MAQSTEAEAAKALDEIQGEQAASAGGREPQFCGDIGMRIARDGTWFYRGSPIERKALVKLFSTVLRKEADGRYYLVTPAEKVGITVEDAPFIAVSLEAMGKGMTQCLTFRTNLDDEVSADKDHPISFEIQPGGSFAPYVRVRGDLMARLSRPVYYELVELAETTRHGFGVWSGGTFFPFPALG